MFVIATLADTIRIDPQLFFQSTRTSVHQEIDKKYPNRVLMDVGLVICRYGDVPVGQIGDGMCVPGEGAAHHEVVFRCIIFRPFVEEVCLGHIVESTEEGITVSLGDFFSDIFIPAYWMLRPSEFDKKSGLWVWTPDYGDGEEDGDEGEHGDEGENGENVKEEGGEGDGKGKGEGNGDNAADGDAEGDGDANADADDQQEEEDQRYEMEIGSEIRFKVKGINFTQITNTAKGVQATTTSTTSRKMPAFNSAAKAKSDLEMKANGGGGDDSNDNRPIRKRSSSVDLSDSMIPACMHITASICEDGLGLVSWWSNQEEGEEEEGEEGYEEGYEEGEGGYKEEGESQEGQEQDQVKAEEG